MLPFHHGRTTCGEGLFYSELSMVWTSLGPLARCATFDGPLVKDLGHSMSGPKAPPDQDH